MNIMKRLAVALLVFGLFAVGQESTVVPDASCVTECEAVGNGYQICRTVAGNVRGCTGSATNQAALDGYEPDPSCTTPCQETENGLAFCVDDDGAVKGCTSGLSSLGMNNETIVGESAEDGVVANSSSSAASRLYQADSLCSTPCQETSQGFVFCTTSSGEVKGCVGGPAKVESATVTDTIGSVVYVRDSMCSSRCQETDKGLVYCTTSSGKAKGCLPSTSSSMSGNNQSNGSFTFTGSYRPDPECQGACVFTDNGFAYCATASGQIRGCLGGAEVVGSTIDSQGSSAVAEGYKKDASCDSECKSYNGFWACTTATGEIKGCTGSNDELIDSPSYPAGGYSPDPSCTTNCQEVSAGLWGCLTIDEQVRGCVSASASAAGSDQLLPQVPGIAQKAAECTTECKSYNGLPACMDGEGRIFGCTGGPAQPSEPDRIIVTPGDEANKESTMELSPAPECTTDCQTTDAGFVICFTQDGKVKGCIDNDLLASTDDDSSSGGTDVGAIVGGVIGGLAAVALIAGGAYYYRKKKKSTSFKKFQDDQSITISLGYNIESSTSEVFTSPQATNVEAGPPTTMPSESDVNNNAAVSIPVNQEVTSSSSASRQGSLSREDPVNYKV